MLSRVRLVKPAEAGSLDTRGGPAKGAQTPGLGEILTNFSTDGDRSVMCCIQAIGRGFA